MRSRMRFGTASARDVTGRASACLIVQSLGYIICATQMPRNCRWPRSLPKGPRLTVDAQRVDGIDKLLVHLHGPHDSRLLRAVALAVAVLTALSLCIMSDRASAPDDLCVWWLAADAKRKVSHQWLFLDGISVTEVGAHPLVTLPLFVVTLGCLIVVILP